MNCFYEVFKGIMTLGRNSNYSLSLLKPETKSIKFIGQVILIMYLSTLNNVRKFAILIIAWCMLHV